MDYNQTLNLPKTDFPMRAALPQREPEFLKAWEENDQYRQLMQHNEGKPLFVLHDGPPYANGDIHIGHAMNKTLIRFDLADYYGGLHCGECLEVFTGGKWKPTRMEYGDNWYLAGVRAEDLNGLLVRI